MLGASFYMRKHGVFIGSKESSWVEIDGHDHFKEAQNTSNG
jgi:hypothetical protein